MRDKTCFRNDKFLYIFFRIRTDRFFSAANNIDNVEDGNKWRYHRNNTE